MDVVPRKFLRNRKARIFPDERRRNKGNRSTPPHAQMAVVVVVHPSSRRFTSTLRELRILRGIPCSGLKVQIGHFSPTTCPCCENAECKRNMTIVNYLNFDYTAQVVTFPIGLCRNLSPVHPVDTERTSEGRSIDTSWLGYQWSGTASQVGTAVRGSSGSRVVAVSKAMDLLCKYPIMSTPAAAPWSLFTGGKGLTCSCQKWEGFRCWLKGYIRFTGDNNNGGWKPCQWLGWKGSDLSWPAFVIGLFSS